MLLPSVGWAHLPWEGRYLRSVVLKELRVACVSRLGNAVVPVVDSVTAIVIVIVRVQPLTGPCVRL